MRRFIPWLIFLCFIGAGGAYAQSRQEALQTLMDAYGITETDIESLLILDEAVDATIIENGILKLEDTALPDWGKGETVIYEFSDYQCGYCRYMFPLLVDAVDKEKVTVKIIELPILGALSTQAAHYAIAAQQQGKYEIFHRRLMGYESLDEDRLTQLAAQTLDLEQAKEYIGSPAVADHIQRNYQLARLFKIRGTPAFIINNKVYRGALKEEDFKELFDL